MQNISTIIPEEPRDLPLPISGEQLSGLDIGDTEWILGTLLPFPGLIAISGPPESYKTFFALWMAIRASQGLSLFEIETDVGKVENMGVVNSLFIEEENTLRVLKSRYTQFKRDEGKNIYFSVDCGFKMADPEWRAKMLEFIEEHHIRLVFLDPFSSVMGFRDENNNAEVSELMDIIRKEFLKRDITVVFIHHPPKNSAEGSLRGAGDILGKVDVHLSLAVSNPNTREIDVKYAKMRVADRSQFKDFKIRLDGNKGVDNWEFIYLGEQTPKFVEERTNLRRKIEEAFEDGIAKSRQEVADELEENSSGRKFNVVWKKMKEAGELKKQGRKFIHKGLESW